MFEAFAAIVSGIIVGTITAALGGGGSILSVPLLIYFVGISDTHLAIGTSAVAVTAISLLSLLAHARAGQVRWDLAKWMIGFGLIGVCVGALLAQRLPGDQLLILLGGLMLYVGFRSILRRTSTPAPECTPASRPKLAGSGTAIGLVSGLFGISAGFLIVPVLRALARISLASAVGTSLAIASIYALGTAATYAVHASLSWPLAIATTAGGALGGPLGIFIDRKLKSKPHILEKSFGISVALTGLLICAQQIQRLLG